MGFIQEVSTGILSSYHSLLGSLPSWLQQVLNLFFLIILIFIYAIFIWKFYRFIARKNIINLNLSQYNKSEHPLFSKLIAGVLYLTEYLLILPILVFLWFGVFSFFLIFLTENLEVKSILIASATIVGAIRLISYMPHYGQTLAKEISKLIPLSLLAVSMTKIDFFNFERILSQISQISTFFNDIIIYLLFIIFLEFILRILEFLLSLANLKDVDPTEGEEEED